MFTLHNVCPQNEKGDPLHMWIKKGIRTPSLGRNVCVPKSEPQFWCGPPLLTALNSPRHKNRSGGYLILCKRLIDPDFLKAQLDHLKKNTAKFKASVNVKVP